MKKSYLLLVIAIISFVMFTPTIKAAEEEEEYYDYCTLSEYNQLRQLAGAVTVTFKHEKTVLEQGFFTQVKVGKFAITVSNLGDALYAVETKTNKMVDGTTPKISNLDSNNTYTVSIYAIDGCTNKPLLTRYVNIPWYNPFSEEEACKEYKEFYMCDKWYSIFITEEQFENALEKYKENLRQEALGDQDDDKDKTFLDALWEFTLENYIYILIIIATGCIVGIIILVNRERRMML